MSLSISMAQGEDNQAIFLVELTSYSLPDAGITTYRWCSSHKKDLVIDGTTYYGTSVGYNSFSNLTDSIELEGGGSIANNHEFSFALKRYDSVSATDGFFNEFYPATSGKNLIGSDVRIGLVWDTVNLVDATDITWLKTFKVTDMSYDMGQLYIICQEIDDFNGKILPPYKIQKESENYISYFSNCDDTVQGRVIPIVYGTFGLNIADYLSAGQHYLGVNVPYYTPAPAIEISSRLGYIISCHKCDMMSYNSTDGYFVYRYLDGLDTYMMIRNSTALNSTYENTEGRHLCYLHTGASNTQIIGWVYIKLFELVRDRSGLLTVDNIVDYDDTTYETLAHGDTILALKIGRSISTSEIGILGQAATDIKFVVYCSSDDANNRTDTLNYYNPSTSGYGNDTSTTIDTGTTPGNETFSFGDMVDSKTGGALPWTIEELCELVFEFKNTDADAGDDIRVRSAWLYLENINVLNMRRKNLFSNIRSTGGRGR